MGYSGSCVFENRFESSGGKLLVSISIIILFFLTEHMYLACQPISMLVSSCQESIYGKRDGAITGIAVMHMDKANSFRRCSLWNRGVVDNVEMLSRSNMFKPQVSCFDQLAIWCSKNYGKMVAAVLLVITARHTPKSNLSFLALRSLVQGFDRWKGKSSSPWKSSDRRPGAQAGNSLTDWSAFWSKTIILGYVKVSGYDRNWTDFYTKRSLI